MALIAVVASVAISAVVLGNDAWWTAQVGNASVPSVFINEVMADNDASVPGPNSTFPDWVELYNGGNDTADLSGMCLTDDASDPTKWRFPNDTYIAAGGFLIVWSNGYNGSGVLHTSFAISANGETLSLYSADGETLIDSVTLKKQLRDVSFGRDPDGGPKWEYFTKPSPDAANVKGPLPSASSWLGVLLAALAVATIVVVVVIMGRRTRGAEA